MEKLRSCREAKLFARKCILGNLENCGMEEVKDYLENWRGREMDEIFRNYIVVLEIILFIIFIILYIKLRNYIEKA